MCNLVFKPKSANNTLFELGNRFHIKNKGYKHSLTVACLMTSMHIPHKRELRVGGGVRGLIFYQSSKTVQRVLCWIGIFSTENIIPQINNFITNLKVQNLEGLNFQDFGVLYNPEELRGNIFTFKRKNIGSSTQALSLVKKSHHLVVRSLRLESVYLINIIISPQGKFRVQIFKWTN